MDKQQEIQQFRENKLPYYQKLAAQPMHRCRICGQQKPISEMFNIKTKLCRECATNISMPQRSTDFEAKLDKCRQKLLNYKNENYLTYHDLGYRLNMSSTTIRRFVVGDTIRHTERSLKKIMTFIDKLQVL